MNRWGVSLLLAVLQLLTGIILNALCIYTMTVLVTLPWRDWPIWAAAPLVSAGIIAIVTVIASKHYKSEKNKKPIFVLKVVSFALSSLSLVLCFVAASFLFLHVVLFIDCYSTCRDDILNKQCYCKLSAPHQDRVYLYGNITCNDLQGIVKVLFYCTAAVSLIGGISCLFFLILLWSHRYNYFYAGMTNIEQLPEFAEQYSTPPS